MTHETVRSADGTAIAYETSGQGPALVTVCGATCDRALMRPTAQALGAHFTTIDYDRRGRGDSGDTPPYAVEREIEDLAALIDRAGGRAHLYGHSSGAGLVLHAVAAGLPVDRFVLHDPPWSPDDAAAREEARQFGATLRDLLREDRRAEALQLWFRGTGMPEEAFDELRRSPTWPGLLAVAPTLAHDSAVMGDVERGGAVPEELAAAAARPALVLVGGASPPFMLEVGRRVAELLPDGRFQVLEGQEHVVPPEVLAPVVTDFLAA
ncbi:alpha/beta fold hydrolase [Geodermatophilus sp. SYSU D00815]